MFNVFGRKKRDEKPTPPWLMWLVIIFLLYSILASYDESSSVHKGLKQAKEHIETQDTFRLEDYTRPLSPGPQALRIKEVSPGSGPPAICGEEVTIAYEAMLSGNIPAKEQAPKDNPYSFRIGEKKATPMFEEGIMGMQAGGRRSLIAPLASSPLDADQQPGLTPETLVKIDVELLSITETLPDSFSSAYRMADIAPGGGGIIRCGDTFQAHVTLWDIRGKKLFSSRDEKRPLELSPGSSGLFVGLEQGAIGMRRGGMRTLIVPPEFQKTLRGNKPAIDLPLPLKETVIVDVEAF